MTPYPKPETSKETRRSGLGTRWIAPNKTRRRFAVVDYSTGRGVADTGEILRLRKYPPLSDLLRRCGDSQIERVFLTGNWPKDRPAWLYSKPLPEGWTQRPHYFATKSSSDVLRFTGPGGAVEVQHVGEWFGDNNPTPAEALEAFTLIGDVLRFEFDGFELKNRPSTTGRHLWRSSIDYGVEWPVAHVDDQELLRATSTQARVEFVGVGDVVEKFFELDARWAYAHCVRELGTGEITHDAEKINQRAFLAGGPHCYGRGWHHISHFTPPGLCDLGIIPVATDDGWKWPTKHGADTWAGSWELTLAAQYGWHFVVDHSMTFGRVNRKTGPLDTWAGRSDRPTGLIRAELNARTSDSYAEPVRKLASTGIKSILRNTIGTFHSASAKVQHSIPIARSSELPRNALDVIDHGSHIVWTENATHRTPDEQHPELSVQVWDRCRRLIANHAMTMPREQLLGIATDALYVTENPEIADRGRVGDLRLKAEHAAPEPGWRPSGLTDLWSARG